jgi:hypothetical protein
MSETKIATRLDTATVESLMFLTKAFRGGIVLDEPGNRMLLAAATSTVGAWSRVQATESARQQTALVRANIFARDLGGKTSDYLEDAPEPKLIEGGDNKEDEAA